MARIGSTLGRHQLSSLAATAVDFGTMTLLVEGAGAAPALATLVSATLGAVVNFTLVRRHVFAGARGRPVTPQAIRYGAVSAASALLNAAGEHLGTRVLGAPYLLVRVLVAAVVSLGWNYPLHRGFVFRPTAESS